MEETGIIEPLILQDENVKCASGKSNCNCRVSHSLRFEVDVSSRCISHLFNFADKDRSSAQGRERMSLLMGLQRCSVTGLA